MGREREVEPQVVERGGGGAGGQAVGRLGDRFALGRSSGALVAVAAAYALARLREVGEVQLHAAGADDVEGALVEDRGRERGDLGLGAGLSGARAGGRGAQPHDGAAQRLPALERDGLLEQAGEQLRVPIEAGRGERSGRFDVGDRHRRPSSSASRQRRPYGGFSKPCRTSCR